MLLGTDKQHSIGRRVVSREEVDAFLGCVRDCLNDDSRWMINNHSWAGGRVNKTQLFMAEKNISDEDVAEVVRELEISNYCYTDDDGNSNFPNETFWFFGITKEIIDSEIKLYVKLKIRRIDEDELLLIMSFHPEQPYEEKDILKFPYANK